MNASGATPGTIRLSAGNDLTLTAGSVLDAHGTARRSWIVTDNRSTAENTASVTLTSVNGTLSIAPAAAGAPAPVINVAAPAGVTCALGACGQVTLNAPRLGGDAAGDVAISVPAAVTIQGAGSVVVNAFQTYPNISTITQTWFGQSADADAGDIHQRGG